MPDPTEKPADEQSPHETEFIIAFDTDDDELSVDVVQLDPLDDE